MWGFSPSWTYSMCLFRCNFHAKPFLHLEHLFGFCGFKPSCTAAKCFFKLLVLANEALQISLASGFFLSWTDAIWWFRWCSRTKVEFQMAQIHTYMVFFLRELMRCVSLSVVLYQIPAHKWHIFLMYLRE